MKHVIETLIAAFLCLIYFLSGGHGSMSPFPVAYAACYGKITNPVTDVCWDCVFPIKVGGAQLSKDGINDPVTDASAVCVCQKGVMLAAGMNLSFFEPLRTVEIVRTPWCFPSLGGVTIETGVRAASHGRSASRGKTEEKSHTAFYQAHWYHTPWLFILESILDTNCLEQSPWDLAYMTEVDPIWDDAWASFVLAPESALFSNPAAVAACAADCVAATLGSPRNELFWCDGCRGSLYPLAGWVASMTNPLSTWHLLTSRMTVKLAREGLLWAAYGKRGQCSPYFEPIPRKDVWRTQLVYPKAETSCYALGASRSFAGPGRVTPIKGEDGAILLWRKRDCCEGLSFFTKGVGS